MVVIGEKRDDEGEERVASRARCRPRTSLHFFPRRHLNGSHPTTTTLGSSRDWLHGQVVASWTISRRAMPAYTTIKRRGRLGILTKKKKKPQTKQLNHIILRLILALGWLEE